MAQPLYLKVFLSSPADVLPVRKAAMSILTRCSDRPAFRDKVIIRVVAWDKPGADTPMLAQITPQDAINSGLPKPSECDIIVVIFGAVMGTPFVYESGQEWRPHNSPKDDNNDVAFGRLGQPAVYGILGSDLREHRSVRTWLIPGHHSNYYLVPKCGAIRESCQNTHCCFPNRKHICGRREKYLEVEWLGHLNNSLQRDLTAIIALCLYYDLQTLLVKPQKPIVDVLLLVQIP